MKTRITIVRSLTCLVLIAMLSGCGVSKKPRTAWWQFWRKKPEATSTKSGDMAFNEPPPPVDFGSAGGVNPLGADMAPLGIAQADSLRADFQPIGDLQTVYFDFDQAIINADTASTLDRNADWIRGNSSFHIQIEGHCDERGTREYNINLGQLRADAVREYLVLSGISADRLHSISYGEERPLDAGMTENSFAQNRRVQFLVYDPNI